MKNNKGFSLIELIVSIAIMSIVLVIATTMMTNASRFFERQSAEVELQNEAQIVTNYLSEAFMEATAMECTAESFTESGGLLKMSGAMTIVLYGTKTDDTGAVSVDGKGEQRVIYLTPNADGMTYSLYMVSFDSEDAIPSSSTYTAPGYLISDNVSTVVISIPYATVEDSNAEPLPDGSIPTINCVTNPIKPKVEFVLTHTLATSNFELEANCRNLLDKITITDASGTKEYEAYNR